MNDLKPTIGIKFKDKYLDAKSKMLDFVIAFDSLTNEQKGQLTNEFLELFFLVSSKDKFIEKAKQIRNSL